jgi:hypothetical protein
MEKRFAHFSINGSLDQSSFTVDWIMRTSLSGCIPCSAHSLQTEIRRATVRSERAIVARESFEDLVYSVIAASALVALLLGILDQLNSPAPGAQSDRTEWTSVTEPARPSQGKDGKF